jgi:hypothetical protein
MPRIPILLAALLCSFTAVAQQPAPAPTPDEVAKLVEQLGSDEFAEREAAEKRLTELGPSVLEELRAGLKSENPETVRRVRELIRKAERRLANEKATAPTLVEINAKDKALDSILADLSKQARCEVVLGGLGPGELANKKLTVSTGGKVPFWEAVLKVCDTADLQIAGVAGFYAPGSVPYLARGKVGVRLAVDIQHAVVLEPRGETPKRPAATCGAVLVESVPFPRDSTSSQPAALLQMWPEPRMLWEGTAGLKVAKAVDSASAKLTGEYVSPGESLQTDARGTVLVRNPDGTASLVRDTGSGFQLPGTFRANPRQAVVRFKAGETSATVAKVLDLTIFATIRSSIEPLSQAAGLEANQAGKGAGSAGVDLSVTYRRNGAEPLEASVEVTYDPKLVHPAGAGDDLPGVKGAGGMLGNHTVYGVRVTDADGKPYTLGITSGINQFDPTGKRFVMKMRLNLYPDKDGQGPPTTVTFWGTHARTVDLPVLLKNVPLTVGK